MRRSTSNRTSGRLFDNPSIRGLSLGALDPYVRRQVRGTRPTILFFSAAGRTVPDFLARWVNGKGLTIVPVPDPADVEQRVLRSLPQLVVIDADGGPQGLALCARLKADSYSAIVPLAVLTSRHTTDRVQEWFTAGADEVISPLFEPTEQASRLDGLMTRTARDVAVNPSTRLPGTTEIAPRCTQQARPARVLLRNGARRTPPPRPADPADYRHRDQPAPPVRAPGAGERARHGDEELRENAAGLGVRGRPPPRPGAGRRW